MKKEEDREQERQVWENIDLLYKKLENGEASDEDRKKIEEISQIIRKITASRNRDVRITPSLLQKLREKDILFFRKELGLDISTHEKSRKTSILMNRFKYVGMGIAASLLVIIGMFSFYYNHTTDRKMVVIRCLNDSTVHLPDKSTVQLAAGSSLAVASDFGQKERRVTLDGEGFFKVTKNPAKAFIVQTSSVSAIVHGTSFNVMAYKEMKNILVDVRTGCVEVADSHRSFGRFHIGDQVSYNRLTSKVLFSKVNPDDIGTWRKGFFTVENAPVDELASRIRHRYGYRLVIIGNSIPADAQINYRSYTPWPYLHSVIRSICNVYGADFKIEGKRIEIYYKK